MPELTSDEHARLAELEGRWWHSITLPDGSVTGGWKSPERLEAEWQAMNVPPLAGRSVLDIGAWDGYFSFRAEREGAASVTSLDHFVWSIDPIEKMRYEERQRDTGEPVRPFDEVPELWRPDELPGKRSFDTARAILGSSVQPVVADFMNADLAALPRADVVFFLGVLYHLKDPVRAFERLRAVTQQVAIVETEAIHLPTYPTLPIAEFVPADGLYGDPTNWWAPNLPGLVGMAEAAGFTRVEAVGPGLDEARDAADAYVVWARDHGPEPYRGDPNEAPDLVYRYRAVIHCWA